MIDYFYTIIIRKKACVFSEQRSCDHRPQYNKDLTELHTHLRPTCFNSWSPRILLQLTCLVSDADAVWALVSVGLLTITDDEVLLQILTQCLLPSLFRVVLQRIVSRVCLQHLLPDHHVLRLHHYMWVTLILWRKPTIWCLTWDRKKNIGNLCGQLIAVFKIIVLLPPLFNITKSRLFLLCFKIFVIRVKTTLKKNISSLTLNCHYIWFRVIMCVKNRTLLSWICNRFLKYLSY